MVTIHCPDTNFLEPSGYYTSYGMDYYWEYDQPNQCIYLLPLGI